MKKVVTINLNGRAYQVEEDGYIQLSRYLETAQKKLDKNPDKEEILADIEQAIADKCDGELGAGKNVVTITAVDRVLEKVGVIQGDVDTDDETGDEDTGGYEVKRKLYRLPSKGRLFGVCAGVGAYFGTDTTIIRLLFILLTLLTNGFMILVYILLAVVMPEAKNSEQIAEAHGKPGTAREIAERLKDATTDKDNVERIGGVITLVGTVIAKAIMIVSALIFGALSLVWVWLIGAIGLGGLQFADELATLNGVKQTIFLTAVYIVLAVPFFIVVRALDRVGKPEKQNDQRGNTFVYGSLVALIVTATVVISAFFSVYGETVQRYMDVHEGNITIGTHTYCIDDMRCASHSVRIQESTRP